MTYRLPSLKDWLTIQGNELTPSIRENIILHRHINTHPSSSPQSCTYIQMYTHMHLITLIRTRKCIQTHIQRTQPLLVNYSSLSTQKECTSKSNKKNKIIHYTAYKQQQQISMITNIAGKQDNKTSLARVYHTGLALLMERLSHQELLCQGSMPHRWPAS